MLENNKFIVTSVDIEVDGFHVYIGVCPMKTQHTKDFSIKTAPSPSPSKSLHLHGKYVL